MNNPAVKLPLNLIPSTSWWKNVRSKIPKSKWDTIRRKVYQQANYTCEICGIKNVRLDCNEVWDYQFNNQTLIRLEAICRPCHLTQRMGFASVVGKQQVAFDHLLKVNNCELVSKEKFMFKKSLPSEKKEVRLNESWTTGFWKNI